MKKYTFKIQKDNYPQFLNTMDTLGFRMSLLKKCEQLWDVPNTEILLIEIELKTPADLFNLAYNFGYDVSSKVSFELLQMENPKADL